MPSHRTYRPCSAGARAWTRTSATAWRARWVCLMTGSRRRVRLPTFLQPRSNALRPCGIRSSTPKPPRAAATRPQRRRYPRPWAPSTQPRQPLQPQRCRVDSMPRRQAPLEVLRFPWPLRSRSQRGGAPKKYPNAAASSPSIPLIWPQHPPARLQPLRPRPTYWHQRKQKLIQRRKRLCPYGGRPKSWLPLHRSQTLCRRSLRPCKALDRCLCSLSTSRRWCRRPWSSKAVWRPSRKRLSRCWCSRHGKARFRKTKPSNCWERCACSDQGPRCSSCSPAPVCRPLGIGGMPNGLHDHRNSVVAVRAWRTGLPGPAFSAGALASR